MHHLYITGFLWQFLLCHFVQLISHVPLSPRLRDPATNEDSASNELPPTLPSLVKGGENEKRVKALIKAYLCDYGDQGLGDGSKLLGEEVGHRFKHTGFICHSTEIDFSLSQSFINSDGVRCRLGLQGSLNLARR